MDFNLTLDKANVHKNGNIKVTYHKILNNNKRLYIDFEKAVLASSVNNKFETMQLSFKEFNDKSELHDCKWKSLSFEGNNKFISTLETLHKAIVELSKVALEKDEITTFKKDNNYFCLNLTDDLKRIQIVNNDSDALTLENIRKKLSYMSIVSGTLLVDSIVISKKGVSVKCIIIKLAVNSHPVKKLTDTFEDKVKSLKMDLELDDDDDSE